MCSSGNSGLPVQLKELWKELAKLSSRVELVDSDACSARTLQRQWTQHHYEAMAGHGSRSRTDATTPGGSDRDTAVADRRANSARLSALQAVDCMEAAAQKLVEATAPVRP
ncbi:unnamed protein product [Polarella glacialis]|uniref:Uncharacterized protein n=1 Tax=Polarella glacialis TaxID=89957 RepID=A0A813FZ27_POLGL|nr:unnamed protein product [Polarella glacialis]